MPDDPISTTPNLELGQWGDKKNPGFEALNENWAKIDTAVGALEEAVAGKAPQTSVDSLTERVDDLETADGENVKRDGSVAMTGDLDLGDNQAKNLANGSDPKDAVTVQQMEAAITALESGLVGGYSYVLARTTVDIEDTSPVLFIADENDPSTTNEDMHVEETPPFIATQDGFYLAIFRGKVANGGGASAKWLVNGVEAPACVLPLVLKDVGFDEDENEGIVFLQDVCPIPLSEGDEVTLEIYGLEGEPLKIKAESTVAMFLLMANASGGGDFKSDGSVPMTGNLDLGGNKGINAADGEDPTDLATVGQLEAAVDDLQGQIDGIEGGGTLQMPEVEVVSGAFSFTTAWSEFSASRLTFTLAGSTRVLIHAEATALPDFLGRADAQIGIRLQKLIGGNPDGAPEDFYGTQYITPNLGFNMYGGLVCDKRKTIAAGDWRVSIICRRPGGTTSSAAIRADSTGPARIGLTYQE